MSRLRQFWEEGHADAERPLRAWFHETERSSWQSPDELKRIYPHASIIGGNRVIFNIGGNKYRMVVKVHYDAGRIYVRWIGTHAEYDKIKAEEV